MNIEVTSPCDDHGDAVVPSLQAMQQSLAFANAYAENSTSNRYSTSPLYSNWKHSLLGE